MTDLKALKRMFVSIGCNFFSCNTLIGATVTIQTETKSIDFEFDDKGNFLRII